MRATILTIGDEILIGQVTDTNATYMAAALSEEGITVVEHLSVADSRMGIMSGLDRALEQSDLVLMTGGLGPTKDDITKQVLADYFGAELRLHNPSWKHVQKIFSRYGRKATDVHKEQCRLPTGAKVLTNERGTAPGLWLEKDDQVVVSMPGVPYEMQYLMEQEVMRRLKRRHFDAEILRSLTILTAGEGESTIAERLQELEENLPEHMSLAYLPNLGTVRLRISARGDDEAALRQDLEAYRQEFERILGNLIFGYGKDDLVAVVARALEEKQQTLATAESCTGGRLGSLLTARAGASTYYAGGVVAYSNRLKTQLLGVPDTTLEEFGAVSQETVAAMAEGARERLGTDYALATSGIAGPGGGTAQKPVGTIWIGLATPQGTVTKLLRSGKDRERNIEYTALHALNLLRLELGLQPVVPHEPVKTVPADPQPEATPPKRGRKKAAAKTAKSSTTEAPAATEQKKPERGRKKAATKTVKSAPVEAPAATEPQPPKPRRTPARNATKPAPETSPETDNAEAKPAPKGRPPSRGSARKETADAPAAPLTPAKPKRTPRKKPTTKSDTDPADVPAKPKRTPRRKK